MCMHHFVHQTINYIQLRLLPLINIYDFDTFKNKISAK